MQTMLFTGNQDSYTKAIRSQKIQCLVQCKLREHNRFILFAEISKEEILC